MKKPLLTLSLAIVAMTMVASAQVFHFDISPPGISAAEGLSPSNEVHMVIDSTGSGDEVMTGIFLDTETMILSVSVGYGSAAGFTDLTGQATVMHIHGPAPADGEAGVLVDLASIHIPASDPSKGGVLFGDILLDEPIASNILAGFTYINIHTELNQQGEIRGQLVIDLNSPPSITALEPQTLECESDKGAVAILSVDVSDPDGDPMLLIWEVDGTGYQTNMITGDMTSTPQTITFQAEFGVGTHQVVATVFDDNGEYASTMTLITVEDTVPPEIQSIKLSRTTLWPPNHRLVPVTLRVHATDACGPIRARVVDVSSNEPMNGLGDGNTRPDYEIARPHRGFLRRSRGDVSDWQLISPLRVLLRAERSGNGNGRVYTITVEVRDGSDNSTSETVEVFVPHDRGQKRGHVNAPPASPAPGHPDDDHGNAKDKNKGKGQSNGNAFGKLK